MYMQVHIHVHIVFCMYIPTYMPITICVSERTHKKLGVSLEKDNKCLGEGMGNKYILLFILFLCILNFVPDTCSTLSISLKQSN